MTDKNTFEKDSPIGFCLESFPIKLHDRSYHNDICQSYYFRVNEEYYVLWVDHEDKNQRENYGSSRYTIVKALNEGDEEHPEIFSDTEYADLLQTDDFATLVLFVKSMAISLLN